MSFTRFDPRLVVLTVIYIAAKGAPLSLLPPMALLNHWICVPVEECQVQIDTIFKALRQITPGLSSCVLL
jgi:hypothetical protein